MIVKVSQSVTGALKHYPFTGKSIDDDDEHETRISNVCRHVCVLKRMFVRYIIHMYNCYCKKRTHFSSFLLKIAIIIIIMNNMNYRRGVVVKIIIAARWRFYLLLYNVPTRNKKCFFVSCTYLSEKKMNTCVKVYSISCTGSTVIKMMIYNEKWKLARLQFAKLSRVHWCSTGYSISVCNHCVNSPIFLETGTCVQVKWGKGLCTAFKLKWLNSWNSSSQNLISETKEVLGQFFTWSVQYFHSNFYSARYIFFL